MTDLTLDSCMGDATDEDPPSLTLPLEGGGVGGGDRGSNLPSTFPSQCDLLVDVAVPIAVRHLFTYRLPEALAAQAKRGQRVRVPFRKSEVIGYLAGVHTAAYDGPVKDVQAIIDEEPLLADGSWELAEWIATYYMRSTGEALDLFFPTVLRGGWKKRVDRQRKRKSRAPSELSLKPTGAPETFTDEQRGALDALLPAIHQKRFETSLVHGITGSGKTAVYVELARAAVAGGRGAIILVPEIGLTSHVARHFISTFPERIALIHSGMTPRRRWDEWDRIRTGKVDVVVGARSALFAPLPSLGLIVVDEEHDHAYKQEEGVTYHARDVAIMTGQRRTAPVVLGTATPSIESFSNAQSGKYRLIRLTRRVGERPLPDMDVVDLRYHRNPDKTLPWLSPRLHEAMKDTLARSGQVVLFLNRRGFAPALRCTECGTGVRCPHCDIALTFHKAERLMRCHYCDRKQSPPEVCSECKGSSIRMVGTGTQRIEEDIRALFPSIGVARLDADTARSKGRRFEILDGLESGALQIAVGTQMITKGHHYPQITLVGIVDADLGLHIPDFRSSERTYQQVLQAAGRAGRGEQKGRVIVQTFSPDHHAIQAAVNYDESRFYSTELRHRGQWGYPPYRRLAMLRVKSPHEGRGAEGALEYALRAKSMAQNDALEVLGPTPAPLYRIRGEFRWHVLIKSDSSKTLHDVLNAVMDEERPKQKGYEVRLDVDPMNML